MDNSFLVLNGDIAFDDVVVNPLPSQGVPHWRVKSSGVRQSKIYKCQLSLMEGKGLTIQPLDSGDAVTLVNGPFDSERLFVNTV